MGWWMMGGVAVRRKVIAYRPFKVLDREVRAGEKDYVKFVRALYEVRASKGYREAGFKTFEDYCQKTLGRPRGWANRLIRDTDFGSLDEPKPTLVVPASFNKTNDNIGWAMWSWNPVTGCEHGCDYCYARAMAKRFGDDFTPKFHEERLDAPANSKPADKPGGDRVFVCSMSDLFGSWVPNEWIGSVMEQVDAHPEWTFLFLTKNPRRYESVVFPENAWVGATVDTQARVRPTEHAMDRVRATVRFVSLEPLLEPITFTRPELFDWFLIGAKSEGAKKVQPANSWVFSLIGQAESVGSSWWRKDNLTLQEAPTLREEAP